MAKRSADGENAERVAKNEESREGGWESDVFETGLLFGGLTLCFFDEAAVAISVEYRTGSCHVSAQSRLFHFKIGTAISLSVCLSLLLLYNELYPGQFSPVVSLSH